MKKLAFGAAPFAAAALACGAAVLVLAACGDSTPQSKVAGGGSKDQSKWPSDDRTMCDWRNKPELEVSETAGPGALRPNVRRVYKMIGEGDMRHKVLVCREIDTNLDGVKDTVRNFNAKGEATKEDSDTDYDGKLDVWSTFVNGRMSEEDVDTNHDGVADVWKVYVDGKLSRIKRDRNFDGKPDVWEIYSNGQLERMGIDDNFDGHVDRWDRDESLREGATGGGGGGAGAGTGAGTSGSDAGAAAPQMQNAASADAGAGGAKK